jgi:hypothetical protein
LQDPELRQLVETPEMTAWMAPRRHLMAYNIVSAISFPPKLPRGAWRFSTRKV